MKIDYLKKSHISDLNEIIFDLVIVSSGFEKRSSYQIEKYKFNSNLKLCLGFKNNKKFSREYNDKILLENGYEIVEVDSNSYDNIYTLLNEYMNKLTNLELEILVDFSSMSTLMYASILRYFNECNKYKEVNIYFTYTQALFTKPDKKKSLKFNNPINILNNIELTDKKIALIIGLGYDKDKALGLYEYFQNDLEDMFVFLTSSNEFSYDVKDNNKELLNVMNKNNIIYYELSNISYLTSSLNSLVTFLSNMNFRIVIVPTGPKVFSLISLIISIYNSNISVYRASTDDSDFITDKVPDIKKDIIITKVNFKSA